MELTGKNKWPSPQEYNEVLQFPSSAFPHNEFRNATVTTDSLGMPKAVSGGFACVYQLTVDSRVVALRCFVQQRQDLQQRYKLISEYLTKHQLPFMVEFTFVEQGIRVENQWFPVLAMDWVDGVTLERYVEAHLPWPRKLKALADRFDKLCMELSDIGIAHGDLQHGNILVQDSGLLQLVDYDGMFVPDMSDDLLSAEFGHRHYQHPSRSAQNFDSRIDNFSMSVISLSLHTLAEDPSLFHKVSADDFLLFKDTDYKDPLASRTFCLLEGHKSHEVRRMARLMRLQCGQSIAEVFPLNKLPIEAHNIPPITTATVHHELKVGRQRQPKYERTTVAENVTPTAILKSVRTLYREPDITFFNDGFKIEAPEESLFGMKFTRSFRSYLTAKNGNTVVHSLKEQ